MTVKNSKSANDLFSEFKKVEIKKNNLNSQDIKEQDIIFRTKDYDYFVAYPNEGLRLKPLEPDKYEELKRSIIEQGITTPIKVIKAGDYQGNDYHGEQNKMIILGGHNRLNIAKELKIEIPYYIFSGLSLEQTDRIVAEEHLLNRQQTDFLPSEIYHLLVALKYQNDNNEKFIDKVINNDSFSMKKTNIYRFLKLKNLYHDFLYDWLDNKKIALRTALCIAEKSNNEQMFIWDYFQNKHIDKISYNQGFEISNLELVNEDSLDSIFKKKKNPDSVLKPVKFKVKEIEELIPEEDRYHAKEIIVSALLQYYKK